MPHFKISVFIFLMFHFFELFVYSRHQPSVRRLIGKDFLHSVDCLFTHWLCSLLYRRFGVSYGPIYSGAAEGQGSTLENQHSLLFFLTVPRVSFNVMPHLLQLLQRLYVSLRRAIKHGQRETSTGGGQRTKAEDMMPLLKCSVLGNFGKTPKGFILLSIIEGSFSP